MTEVEKKERKYRKCGGIDTKERLEHIKQFYSSNSSYSFDVGGGVAWVCGGYDVSPSQQFCGACLHE